MIEMDEFYGKIQMLLTKKNQEYGELRFLSSRSTTENKSNIDDLLRCMEEIFQKYNLLSDTTVAKTDSRHVQAFKYLLVNVYFTVQKRLAEDLVNGHLVDMCPPLSPYLFIEILWHFKYENVLVESLLYIPLDLCLEILDIVSRRNEHLDFERTTKTIFGLITNIYKKIILLKDHGCQCEDVTRSVDKLVAHFQELALLLTNPNIIRLSEVSGIKRHERYGLVLKELVRTIKSCVEDRNVTLSAENEKLYKITFGREPFAKCEESFIKEKITELDQALINVLLNQIKKVDCNIYLGWAELDDRKNASISLQRSIGKECYYLMGVLKNDAELSRNEHLLECLQQLSSKPDAHGSGSILTLEELCHDMEHGKPASVKELLSRYREWDRSIIDRVARNASLLDKDDCSCLLEYLAFVLSSSDDAEFRKSVYAEVMNVLISQSLADIFEIVLGYIVRHDARNTLETPGTRESFQAFLAKNTDLKSLNTLKTLLLFLLKNPKEILLRLVEIVSGVEEYTHVMVPTNDLLLISPILNVRTENGRSLLFDTLRTLCAGHSQWSNAKLGNLIETMLDRSMLEIDELINDVFLPILNEDACTVSKAANVAQIIWRFQSRYCDSGNADVKSLLVSLAKRMSFARRSNASKFHVNDEFKWVYFLVGELAKDEERALDSHSVRSVLEYVDGNLEALDAAYFDVLDRTCPPTNTDVARVVRSYEKKCLFAIQTLRSDPKTSPKLQSYLTALDLTKDDVLRYVILKCHCSEYVTYMSQLVRHEFVTFEFAHSLEAFDAVVRLTVECCHLWMTYYPSVGPEDTLTFLMFRLAEFANDFVERDSTCEEREEVYRCLLRHMRSLDECVRDHLVFPDGSNVGIAHESAEDAESSSNVRDKLRDLLDGITNLYTRLRRKEHSIKNHANRSECSATLETSNCKRNFNVYKFISICTKVPNAQVHKCLHTMNEKLFLPV